MLEDVRWDDARGVISIGLDHLHGKPKRVVVRAGRAGNARASLAVGGARHAPASR